LMTIGRCAPRATRPNNNNNSTTIFMVLSSISQLKCPKRRIRESWPKTARVSC